MNRLLFTLTFLVLSLYAISQPTNGLVAKFSFDDIYKEDLTGNLMDFSENGTTFNGAPLADVLLTNGYTGTAPLFTPPNTNQFLNYKDQIIDVNSSFTVTFWFKLDSINTNDLAYLISNRFDTTGTQHGGIDVAIYPDSSITVVGRSSNSDIYTITYTEKVVTNQWYLLTVKRSDTDGFVSVQLNNQFRNLAFNANVGIDTAQGMWQFGSAISKISTGGSVTSIKREMWGMIDEVLFYDRDLSIFEVDSIYNDLYTNTHLIAQEKVNIYPNPAINTINIEGIDNLSNMTGEIIDLNGRRVAYSNLESNQVDVSHLNNGLYFLLLRDENHVVVARKKFLKQ